MTVETAIYNADEWYAPAYMCEPDLVMTDLDSRLVVIIRILLVYSADKSITVNWNLPSSEPNSAVYRLFSASTI